jgi:beta-galactosidase GanA
VQSGKDVYSRPKFVKYLQEVHGEIAKLNALYGTTYKTFEEVAVPTSYSMPAKPNEQRAYYDWCRFNQVNFAEWHRWMNQIVKSIDPAAKTHTKTLVIHAFQQNLVHFGVDPELMCEVTDIAGCDNFVGFDNTSLTSWTSVEFYYDLLNSFRNQPVFNSESHFIPDGLPPAHIPAENSRAVMWQSALHHVGATTIWVWNEPAPGLLGNIYLRPANIYGVGQALLDANRLSGELAAINQARPRVALLYSQPSIFWESGYGGSIMNLHTQLKFVGEK